MLTKTRFFAFAVLLALLPAGIAGAAGPLPLPDYRTESWFLPAAPGVTTGPAAGLFNPGAFGMTARAGTDLWYRRTADTHLDRYGFALGRTVNFAVMGSEFDVDGQVARVWDYQLGLAHGNSRRSFGLGYRWATGATADRPRQNSLILGSIERNRWLSWGSSAAFSLQSGSAQYVFDLGLRPFGRPWLTLGGDWTLVDGQDVFQDGVWGASVELRPWRGVSLGMRARERESGDVDLAAVAGLTIGRTGLWALPSFDAHGNDLGTAVLVRSDPPRAGIDPRALPLPMNHPARYYRTLNLEHKYLTYQKYRYFDSRHLPWLNLLPRLEAMRDDPRLDLVVVNLAGFSGRPSLLWEFRDLLRQIRESGKEIVIQADILSAGTLYLASVADRLSLDPQGQVAIPGVALARTYLKGTLEKLGLGFQAHHYLKYKSVTETLTRENMSFADSLQRARIVDVAYETWRDGTAAGRRMPPRDYDDLVDSRAWLTAQEALSAGLVDTLARWDQLLDWVRKARHAGPTPAPPPGEVVLTDEEWGQPPHIPVVYAVGPCAMDEGVAGRATSSYLRSLVHDDRVKAVVLRVDSPGGEIMPSDLVAAAVTDLREAGKPVIVSQGDVAASGGYWMSLNGTEILTTPLTITGSIGVISGWLWDDGFAAKLGVTSDEVHRGAHADLFTTVSIPLLGRIPRRPMDPGELDRMRHLILGMYDEFLAKVADGRGLAVDEVDSIAQGRVWMGPDAIACGLCDRVGGLADAIDLARERAGIAPWQRVELTEYPPRPLIKLPHLPEIPSLLGLMKLVTGDRSPAPLDEAADVQPEAQPLGLALPQAGFLKAVVAAPGHPLAVMDPDLLPEAWLDAE